MTVCDGGGDRGSEVDASGLANLVELLEQEGLTPHSLLIHQGSELAYEQHWWPHRPDVPHMLHSATKSFVGTAIGIAIDEGRLSLADPLPGLLAPTHRRVIAANSPLRGVTLEDALTMRTGHTEGISGAAWRRMSASWVDDFLTRPVLGQPGGAFVYSSAVSQLLSAIVSYVTGKSVAGYLAPRVFEALGCQSWNWDRDPDGYSTGGNGLSLLPVDFLRWGLLHLHGGLWDGAPLISRGWIERATTPHVMDARSGRFH